MRRTILISGFPGTGKSYFVNNNADYMPQDFALDSDSSKFDKAFFPANYIRHIKSNIGKAKYIFISSHKDVRDALVEEGLDFTLVYPAKELKEEYIARYKARGSSEAFIKLISDNWENWIEELKSQKGCTHIELGAGKYMSNTNLG